MEMAPVRHNSPAPCAYEVDTLKAQHAHMVRLSAMGWTTRDIADTLGVSPQTVRKALKSNVGQRRMAELQEASDRVVYDVQAELRALAPNAVEVIAEVLESADAPINLRHRAAGDVLDRLGFSKVSRSEVSLRHGRLAEVGEDALARAAAEAGLITIDATFDAVNSDVEPVGAGV